MADDQKAEETKEEVKAEETKAEEAKVEETKTDAPKEEKSSKKASASVEKIVEEVAKLSVLDLSELVSALQEKLGVSAMAMAAPASAPAAAAGEAPAAEAGGTQTVVMTNAGSNKIGVIKALREINQNLTLMDAKGMTETVPAEILKDAKAEDAKVASEKLKAAGATVELK